MAIGFYKQTFREGDGGDPMGGGGEALEEFTRLRAYAISVGAISLALCTLVIFYRNIRPGDARAFLEEVTRLRPAATTTATTTTTVSSITPTAPRPVIFGPRR